MCCILCILAAFGKEKPCAFGIYRANLYSTTKKHIRKAVFANTIEGDSWNIRHNILSADTMLAITYLVKYLTLFTKFETGMKPNVLFVHPSFAECIKAI